MSCELSSNHLVGPDLEARQRVEAERVAERDVGRIAATRDEDTPDARDVVARVERVPATVQVRLEPRGEIHRAVRRRHPDVAQIARAIARGNVHAPAERYREV